MAAGQRAEVAAYDARCILHLVSCMLHLASHSNADMPASTSEELLSLNQQLLESIAAGDWETYQRLCDPSLTAFEPEALGHLVEGLAFHEFYFHLKSSSAAASRVT